MAGQDEMGAAQGEPIGQIAIREEMVSEQLVTENVATAKGPPDRTEADYPKVSDWRLRRAAVKEYNRVLEEFRQTGKVEEKEWGDFAHLINPPGLQFHAFNAHWEASFAVDRWLDEQGKVAPVPESRRGPGAADQGAGEPDEPDWPEDEENTEHIHAGSGPSFGDALQDAKDRLDVLKTRAALAELPLPLAPAPLPAVAKPAGLLRGISFDPDLPGRNARFEPAIPQLDVAPMPAQLPPLGDQTEMLLNAMIGECHFLMREVAFPSMCHAGVADDRLHWVGKAMELAKTGATVARAVARLRHGPGVKETRHTTTIVQNRVDAVAEVGGGG